MARLRGTPELRARLKAIKQTFKPAGKAWAESTVHLAQSKVPQKTGRLRRSIRVRNASQKRASVVAHFTANFVDAGTVAHPIVARNAPRLIFQVGGRTIFAKRVNHPGSRARPFKYAAAIEALRRNPLAAQLVELWNRAA